MAIRQVPQPTWKRSDNNLLPQWMRFLEDHKRCFGKNELAELRMELSKQTSACEDFTNNVARSSQTIQRLEERIAALQDSEASDPRDFAASYEQLIAHPNVVGVRTGPWGELVVVFRLNDDPRYGTYEFGGGAMLDDHAFDFSLVGGSHATYRGIVDSIRVLQDFSFRGNLLVKARFGGHRLLSGIMSAIERLDFATVVELLSKAILDYGWQLDESDTENDYLSPSVGFGVLEPVKALQLLYESIGVETRQNSIRSAKRSLENAKRKRDASQENLRAARAKVRNLRARIAEREAAPDADKMSPEEAAELLAYITTIPGVMAIRFESGLPVLHVRNSFVHEGKRYDLGDYEIRPVLDVVEPRIIRTREPIGGSYNAGWSGGDYFCFGSRNSQIYEYYKLGDFAHYMSLVIGTMNSISVIHEHLITQGYFARIGMNDVPQRRLRTRPRRGKRGGTKVA